MLTVTREIRKILRETNSESGSIYTNRYENCRTVKCYVNTTERIDKAQALIEKLCAERNIPVTFKRLRYERSGSMSCWKPGNSFIVRLPL